MWVKIKCWFGRHRFWHLADSQYKVRECMECGRRWRMVRYDMTIVWRRVTDEPR